MKPEARTSAEMPAIDGQEALAETHEEIVGVEDGPDKSYSNKANVNGIEMSVAWVTTHAHDGYEIYFPSIDLQKGREKGVGDQVIGLSQVMTDAADVFNFAKATAAVEGDVYELYKKVEAFARTKS